MGAATPPRSVLITGFPAFLAGKLARRALEADDSCRVRLVVLETQLLHFKHFRSSLPEAQQARLSAFVGDVVDMDLGLSGAEYEAVTAETQEIFHLAGIYWLGADPEEARKVNVEGTREVLRLAKDCQRLTSFCYFSTAFVSGDRTGVVLEEDLDAGQSFRNPFERTRFEAERLVRQASTDEDLPVIIFRPSVIVGHSVTGQIDRMSGPYFLMNAIVNWPVDVPLPLPGRGDAPMNLVPVDFVAAAAHHISRDPRAIGRVFHLTDPNPLPARRVFELVAEAAGRRAPRGLLPTRVARAVMKLPGLSRVSAAPRHFLEYFDQAVIWRCVGTLELLRGTDIQCPPFESYVGALVDFLRAKLESEQAAEASEGRAEP
jgi:thioester reductase-like protein